MYADMYGFQIRGSMLRAHGLDGRSMEVELRNLMSGKGFETQFHTATQSTDVYVAGFRLYFAD